MKEMLLHGSIGHDQRTGDLSYRCRFGKDALRVRRGTQRDKDVTLPWSKVGKLSHPGPILTER